MLHWGQDSTTPNFFCGSLRRYQTHNWSLIAIWIENELNKANIYEPFQLQNVWYVYRVFSLTRSCSGSSFFVHSLRSAKGITASFFIFCKIWTLVDSWAFGTFLVQSCCSFFPRHCTECTCYIAMMAFGSSLSWVYVFGGFSKEKNHWFEHSSFGVLSHAATAARSQKKSG